jgi:hypothetical protein
MNTNNTNNKKMNTSYKTFCKVCQDASKSEKEYTSHNVRDIKGKTCCPTLLAQECRTCYKKGHTSKYCPQANAQAAVVKPAYVAPKLVKTQVQKNAFMCLESDSEDEKEAIVIKKTEPAPVPQAELKATQKQALNYGKIIALAPALVKTEVVAALLKEKVVKPVKIVVAGPKPKLNWADCDSASSGDEDEEEDVEDSSAW